MCEFIKRKHVVANYLTIIELNRYRKTAINLFFKENGLEIIFEESILNRIDKLNLNIEKIEIEKIFKKNKNIMDSVKANIAKNCYVLTLNVTNYPPFLKELKNPPPVLFALGNLDYLFKPSFAVVGTRSASDEGKKRAKKIAYLLSKEGFVVISGLAKGIDTASHESAIKNFGKTIAVIGTPLDKYYPKENKELQDLIARDHLLISQFPFGYKTQKYSFIERNYTMVGLSLATIVVEAKSETSGALIQAKMALEQKRKVFLLESLFKLGIDWPCQYERKGAERIKSIIDIKEKINEVLQDFEKKNRSFDIKIKNEISPVKVKI